MTAVKPITAPRAENAAGALSVLVCCYNMKREIARTLRSLSGGYQRLIDRGDYEVILVDNGSTEPPQLEDFADLDVNLRVLHYPEPTQSPMNALNYGLAACANDLIGVMIDGARMATPGLLAAAIAAAKLHPRAIIFTQSLMLGQGFQFDTIREGYNKVVEDQLLASIDWPKNGYRLFEIGSWPVSGEAEDRWAHLLYESNALFMARTLWEEVGGYDPAFSASGGGTGSIDLFRRACALPDVQLIVITGEATFHQLHDDSASSNSREWARRFKEFYREYSRLRGQTRRSVQTPYWTFGLAPSEAYVRQPDIVRPHLGNPPSETRPDESDIAKRYIELLKQAVLNETNLDFEAYWLAMTLKMEVLGTKVPTVSESTQGQALRRLIASRRVGLPTTQLPLALTLIGRARLENIDTCMRAVLHDGVAGDFVECGVWRGGACIFMAGVLAARGVSDRNVWVADAFEGVPVPDDPLDKLRAVSGLLVSEKQVRQNFERFGLWSDQVRIIPGQFKDLLATPIERIAVLRVNRNICASQAETFGVLYDKVSPGGFVIIDDYYSADDCAKAVDDFRRAHGIDEALQKVDWSAAFWRKVGSKRKPSDPPRLSGEHP